MFGKTKDIQKIEKICRLSERYLDEKERIFILLKDVRYMTAYAM